jgi:hypothetical protein
VAVQFTFLPEACHPGVDKRGRGFHDGTMPSNPGGDNIPSLSAEEQWQVVLAHRPVEDGSRDSAARRFTDAGITAAQVRAVLADGGDGLYTAAQQGGPGWSEPFGGPLAVALLAAEISVLAAQVSSRASGIRSAAVGELLEEYSAVTVAGELGISRQKVYEIARAGLRPPYIDSVPWRTP